jgi:DNA-damage-inducible protein D
LLVVDKAKTACLKSGQGVHDHFVDVNKTISMPKGAVKEVPDMMLTRYACYLIAQNGDPRKEQIAFAQTYFAVQTRKQEIIEERIRLQGEVPITDEHVQNNSSIRGMLAERGIKPEELPPEEDLKKLERRVRSSAKKMIKKS